MQPVNQSRKKILSFDGVWHYLWRGKLRGCFFSVTYAIKTKFLKVACRREQKTEKSTSVHTAIRGVRTFEWHIPIEKQLRVRLNRFIPIINSVQ